MQLYLGINGNREGPYSLSEVEQKVRDGLVPDDTLAWHEGLSEWTKLSSILAAQNPAGPGEPPPPSTPPTPPAPAPAAPPRTSGMAIASLVLGLAGLCGITAVLGLIFGIISLRKINRSQGQLKGGGMAIAGICLSSFMLLLAIPVLAGLFLPALAKAKARAQRINCINNIKQINLGLRMYAEENRGQLPPGDSWCDAITPYMTSSRVFVCPAHSGLVRCSYALNQAVAGESVAPISPETVLIFEVEDGWNAALTELEMVSHHRGGYNVGLLDGSAHQLNGSALRQLDWAGRPR